MIPSLEEFYSNKTQKRYIKIFATRECCQLTRNYVEFWSVSPIAIHLALYFLP